MLTKFEVTNFKNFDKKLTLDFTDTNAYEFNQECVIKGIVNKALIYGHNGTGKSNLGFAIFDLISHLTDKESSALEYILHYSNASNSSKIVEFKYTFKFNDHTVCYEYGKTDFESLVYEKVFINENEYISIDRRNNTVATINAKGAETLKKDMGDSKISIISYIKKNSVLEENLENSCFFKFIDFIHRMLFFRSLADNKYLGLQKGRTQFLSDIIEHDNVHDFESFLNDAGVKCNLKAITGDETLYFDFNGKLIPFEDIASQGTQSLALFYYWYQTLRDSKNVSFVFIDEFDAFYHHSLSKLIVTKLKEINAQVILTTHNTSIMTNDLLRPDCYFLMDERGMTSLKNLTPKELREAHNIEKMYKAGSFSV